MVCGNCLNHNNNLFKVIASSFDSSRWQPKTKKFIDKKNAVTFNLVHRSQKDPLAADEQAPQRVLVPIALKPEKGAEGPASSKPKVELSNKKKRKYKQINECG